MAVNTLTFDIQSSPESNDHQVRVLVDGRDVLCDGHLGIDPPEFFAQFSDPAAVDTLLIGRCLCGTVGCGDYVVSVERDAGDVLWHAVEDFRFDRARYDDTIERAASDFSWEDQKRRAERLTDGILRGCRTPDGFAFQWASARIAPGILKLSFMKGTKQKMLEFDWDGSTDGSVLQGAARFKSQCGDAR